MMVSTTKTFFIAVCGVVSCSSPLPSLFVDAAAGVYAEVECHPQSPSVCVGEISFATPNPAVSCEDPLDEATCETEYLGGYQFDYTFVEGVEEGAFLYDLDQEAIDEAKTGLNVRVTIDDDNVCEITVNGTDTCAMCNTCLGLTYDDVSVSFDCTNVVNGRASLNDTDCESLFDTIFYPLEFPPALEDDTTAAATPDAIADPTVACSADTDCVVGKEYCAQGTCTPNGNCTTDSDCVNPNHVLWRDPKCMGYLYCNEDRRCDRRCGVECPNNGKRAECAVTGCDSRIRCPGSVSCAPDYCDECKAVHFDAAGSVLTDCFPEEEEAAEEIGGGASSTVERAQAEPLPDDPSVIATSDDGAVSNNGNIDSAADSTADSAADSTPDSTADSTAESTADSAAESTAESTADDTADSTVDPAVDGDVDGMVEVTGDDSGAGTFFGMIRMIFLSAAASSVLFLL